MSVAPRIAPGGRADIGIANTLITRVIGAMTGGPPPNVFTTLARNRSLFRRWMVFQMGLMPGGDLPRVDTELVILRVSHNCDCAYEWHHHEKLGEQAGLTPAEIARVRDGADADGWTPRQRRLLRAADELHHGTTISNELWSALVAELSESDIIELIMLIGNYEMLARCLNSFAVEPDAEPAGGSSLRMLLRRRAVEHVDPSS